MTVCIDVLSQRNWNLNKSQISKSWKSAHVIIRLFYRGIQKCLVYTNHVCYSTVETKRRLETSESPDGNELNKQLVISWMILLPNVLMKQTCHNFNVELFYCEKKIYHPFVTNRLPQPWHSNQKRSVVEVLNKTIQY